MAQWTREHEADDVMARMQAAGITAGKMLRLSEFSEVAQLRERRFFREFEQPGLGRLVTENSPAGLSDLPEPALQPAPIQGQHTRELASRLLGLSAVEIERLIDEGVLEVASDEQLAQAGLM